MPHEINLLHIQFCAEILDSLLFIFFFSSLQLVTSTYLFKLIHNCCGNPILWRERDYCNAKMFKPFLVFLFCLKHFHYDKSSANKFHLKNEATTKKMLATLCIIFCLFFFRSTRVTEMRVLRLVLYYQYYLPLLLNVIS